MDKSYELSTYNSTMPPYFIHDCDETATNSVHKQSELLLEKNT